MSLSRKPIPMSSVDRRSVGSAGFHQIPNGEYYNEDITETKSRQRKVYHWRAPTVMLVSLFLGIVLALVHHFFFRYWNERPLDQSWSQTWTLRFGTAFAFLVKMFLALAASGAYVQHQWLTLHTRPHRVIEVDTLFGVLSDVTLFANTSVWVRNPALLFLALVIWIMPLASVVTPATLTVTNKPQSTNTTGQPPQLDYDAAYSAIADYQPIGSVGWKGPYPLMSRIAFGAATAGDVLQIPSTTPNMTYDLAFHGPGVQCGSNQTMQNIFASNYQTGMQGLYAGYTYFSWVPYDAIYGTLNFSSIIEETVSFDTLDRYSPDAAKFYVVRTVMNGGHNLTGGYLLECQLQNISYNLRFDFQYPSQSIDVLSMDVVNSVAYSDNVDDSEGLFDVQPGAYGPKMLSYSAVMASLGQLIVGSNEYDRYGFSTLNTNSVLTQIDFNSSTTARNGIEELARNITFSMFSQSSLLKNSTKAETVPMTVVTYPNFYKYNPKDLYIAYGASILCASICVLFGFKAIPQNGGTFTDRFSTILRTTRDHTFDRLVPDGDDGAGPLPNALAKAEVKFNVNQVG